MGRTPVDDLANTVKDAAYVSVGLGVIAFQRFQVRRQELSKALRGPVGEARGTLETVSALVAERLKVAEERLSATLDR
jgi:hypothetical protein